MQNLFEELYEMSKENIRSLDDKLDQLFRKLGINYVVFTKHFKERLQGREKNIEPKEIYDAFIKFIGQFKSNIINSSKLQGILKDVAADINIPFTIEIKGKDKNLYLITVMRKHDFKTYDKEFKV